MHRLKDAVRAAGLVLGATGLLLVVAGTAPRAKAEPTPVAADYDVYAGGLHVMNSVLEIRLEDRRYVARVDAELVGIPGWFADWWAVVESGGAIQSGELDPAHYSTERFRRGESRKTALDFGRDGEIDVTFEPARNDSNGLVPPELLIETVDPLSGLITVINTVTQGGDCDGTIPVFDGRRRYDLVFTDLGIVELRPSRFSGYAGEARKCRMQLEAVAGAFRQPDDDDDDSIWEQKPENERRRRLDLWLAEPVAGGPTLPVRMVGRSSIGAVVVHYQGARIPDNSASAEASDR